MVLRNNDNERHVPPYPFLYLLRSFCAKFARDTPFTATSSSAWMARHSRPAKCVEYRESTVATVAVLIMIGTGFLLSSLSSHSNDGVRSLPFFYRAVQLPPGKHTPAARRRHTMSNDRWQVKSFSFSLSFPITVERGRQSHTCVCVLLCVYNPPTIVEKI